MARSKLVEANEKLAEGVVAGYRKIETGVVEGYQKIEDGVVGSFGRIADWFVERYLLHEGETLQQAKERLKAEDEARQAAQRR